MVKGSYIDRSGMLFNGVLIESFERIEKGSGTFWNCICHCGKKFICRGVHLVKGHTTSCGCVSLKALATSRLTHGLSKTYEYITWKGAKGRAKKKGRDFNIEVSDIVIPLICPLLGIPILKSKGKISDNSPSLDCFNPSKGYVKGNVWVISQRANSLKRELSLEQWKSFVSKLEENSGNRDCA